MSDDVRLPKGAPILVVVAEPIAQAIARVISDEPPVLLIEAPPVEFKPGGTVTLVFGPRTARFAARARLAERHETSWGIERISPWVRFDGRQSVRYPVSGTAYLTHGGWTVVARTVDISDGGCGLAVAMEEAPDVGSRVRVAWQAFGYAAHLPCIVVGTSPGPEGWVRLHLRFDELAPHQRAFVRTVISASLTAGASAS